MVTRVGFEPTVPSGPVKDTTASLTYRQLSRHWRRFGYDADLALAHQPATSKNQVYFANLRLWWLRWPETFLRRSLAIRISSGGSTAAPLRE